MKLGGGVLGWVGDLLKKGLVAARTGARIDGLRELGWLQVQV